MRTISGKIWAYRCKRELVRLSKNDRHPDGRKILDKAACGRVAARLLREQPESHPIDAARNEQASWDLRF